MHHGLEMSPLAIRESEQQRALEVDALQSPSTTPVMQTFCDPLHTCSSMEMSRMEKCRDVCSMLWSGIKVHVVKLYLNMDSECSKKDWLFEEAASAAAALSVLVSGESRL